MLFTSRNLSTVTPRWCERTSIRNDTKNKISKGIKQGYKMADQMPLAHSFNNEV